MYTQAYITSLLTAEMMFGKGKITSFEELFSAEEKPVDNAIVKEMFTDYMNVWNKKRKEGK